MDFGDLPDRDMSLWVPDGATGPLPVIYAQDGRDMFDPSASIDEWPLELDKLIGELAVEGVGPAIVVAIWATQDRSREYNSPTVVNALPDHVKEAVELSTEGPLPSTDYISFVADVLRPRIETLYGTATGPENTFLFGASMGGLVSIEALATRPDIFGGAIAISAHSIVFGPPAGDPDFPMPEDTFPNVGAQMAMLGAKVAANGGQKLW